MILISESKKIISFRINFQITDFQVIDGSGVVLNSVTLVGTVLSFFRPFPNSNPNPNPSVTTAHTSVT